MTGSWACQEEQIFFVAQYITSRLLRPSTSPGPEISEQILSFVLRGEGNETWGEQTSAKLRVICAADDEQTWQIRRLGRNDEKEGRPLGLIKIFRTLALLITGTRGYFASSLPRFLLLNTKRTRQEEKKCALIIHNELCENADEKVEEKNPNARAHTHTNTY